MSKKKGLTRQIRYRLEYALFLCASWLIRPLSREQVLKVGKALGRLAMLFAEKRKRVAMTNLDIAFGNSKSRQEKKQIIKKSFTQLAVSALQCLWLTHQTEHRVHQLMEETPKGLDTLDQCMARGRGLFFLTAHYGNWEVMGIFHGYQGFCPLYSIVRRLDNPYLERTAQAFRTQSGNGVFYRDDPPLKIVRALKNNFAVAVMMDQNTAKGGIFVDFFGKPAATARSVALLSYRTGAPILPVFSYPTPRGTYLIEYGPELKLEKTGDKDKDVENWTRECEKFIEGVIEENPEHWMWGHRRWKTRPPEEGRNKLYSI